MSVELSFLPSIFQRFPLFRLTALVIGLALCAPEVSAATAYQFRAPDGTIVFSDKPLPLPFKLVKTHDLDWGDIKRKIPKPRINVKAAPENKKRFDLLIAETAEKHRLLPELLHAVIEAESAYDPDAVSHAGAVGLMQLMPMTAKRFGVTDRKDPEQSVEAGATYLRLLLDRFDNDLKLAIASYNAGENAVEKYGRNIPPYRETRHYVIKVLKFLRRNLATMPKDRRLVALSAQ